MGRGPPDRGGQNGNRRMSPLPRCNGTEGCRARHRRAWSGAAIHRRGKGCDTRNHREQCLRGGRGASMLLLHAFRTHTLRLMD